MAKVPVYPTEILEDGTKRDAPSVEVDLATAKKMVEAGEARAIGYGRGIVPTEWKEKKSKKKKGVAEDG